MIKSQPKEEATGANEPEEEPEAYNPLTENVQIEIDERVTCQANKDGDIDKFEVKGIICVTLTDPKQSHAEVQFTHADLKGLSFKCHPDIDK